MIADGPPRRVLELIAEGAAELVLPAPVRAELIRILGDKLTLGDAAINTIVTLLDELAPEHAPVPGHVEAVSGDPDDDRILAAATATKADILVSGDRKHLLALRQHHTMRIINPQAFIAQTTD